MFSVFSVTELPSKSFLLTSSPPHLNAITMTFKLGMKLGFPITKAANGFAATSRRAYSAHPKSALFQSSRATIRPSFSRQPPQQLARRSYADAMSPVTKRRGRRFFRWTWRLTYVSAIGGLGWLGYSIWHQRTPHEQFDPDPSKKTLVILGMLSCT